MIRHLSVLAIAVGLAIFVLVLPDLLDFLNINLSDYLVSSVVMAVLIGYFAGLISTGR